YEVRAWDVTTGKSRWSQAQAGYVYVKLAFSPDGATLAVGSQSGQLSLLYAATGEEERRLGGQGRGGGYQVAVSPDGRSLGTVGMEATPNQSRPVISVWELATGTLRQRLTGHETQVSCLAFSPDGATLATGGQDTAVLLWDLTGRLGREKPKAPPAPAEPAPPWGGPRAAGAKTALPARGPLATAAAAAGG